jgi:RNA polymerase sigma factor (sigma-70 family)
LGVCRRVLGDPHAAADAFQATFLVLARKAGKIGRPERLGGWLSGVARRVAHKARSRANVRSEHERRAARRESQMVEAHDPDVFEIISLVEEELDRLPDAYRRAVQLCCLDGHTTDEAAEMLGWPRGTVGTRVARGREQLRRRLEGRGLSWGALGLCGSVKLPSSLLKQTLFAVSKPHAVPSVVSNLVQVTLRSLFMKKLILASVAGALVVGGAGMWGMREALARGPAGGSARSAPTSAYVDDKSAIQGTWVVTKVDVPEKGAPPDIKDTLSGMAWTFNGDQFESSIPLRPGKISFELDATRVPKTLTLRTENGGPMVAAYKFQGDELWIALGGRESEAPAGFQTDGGEKSPMIVLAFVPEAKAPKLTPEQQKAKQTGVEKAREGARRAQSANNLKQIALAMHNWAEVSQKGLPPAAICDNDGKPLLSWRVAILPYIEENELYKQFHLNEPWDSEHNKALIARMPKIYAPVVAKPKEDEEGKTYYLALVGGGALFHVATPRKLASITDGTSNTIMVAEAAEPVIWTKPDDLTFDPKGELPKMGGTLFEGGFNVVFADGAVKFLKKGLDQKVLRALITSDGAEVLNGE